MVESTDASGDSLTPVNLFSMHRVIRFSALFISLVFVSLLEADVTLAPLFRDGAVLQRDKPVRVWGWAKPGEAVQVQFGDQSQNTVAGAAGCWAVSLSSLPANATPVDLLVSGRNQLRVTGVLVGDVWLCSGQSNMNWAVKDAKDAAKEIAGANNSLIHYFGVTNEVAETPQNDTPGSWQTVAPGRIGAFSAVAYYFARELQPHIAVPLGIIKATPGGSSIEAWMSGDGMEGDVNWTEALAHRQKVLAEFPDKKPAYDRALAEWTIENEAAKKSGFPFTRKKPAVPEGPKSRNAPAGLYNSNVHPLVPYAIRGFLWYQGEANASRYQTYTKLFPTMITQWRRLFRQEDLPFLFVQLANFELANDSTGRQWAFQREAQTSALTLPDTAMAVAIDIGEPRNIHPKNKQEVGRRLALLARRHVHGEALASESPQAVGFMHKGSSIRVEFHHAEGLIARDGRILDLEIAGADKKFHAADAKIEGEALLVSSPVVTAPVAVRYLWRNAPQAMLFNGAGLPVAPFRSDNW